MPTRIIVTQCPLCRQRHAVEVDADAYRRWWNRDVLIQDAFPLMPKEIRELLQTGIDDTCFKRLFADEETAL